MDNIILFGTGKFFCHKICIFDKYNVIQILDNKVIPGNEETYLNTDIPIINPVDMDAGCSEKIFLMTMNFFSMWKQLIELGVSPQRMVYPFFEKPYFQSDSVVDELVDKLIFYEDYIEIKEKDNTVSYVKNENEWFDYLRGLYRKKYPIISELSNINPYPLSEQYATERGTPVDRIYISKFLSMNATYIKGDVLEIEDSSYTKRFGNSNVVNSIVMDVAAEGPSIDFNCNIETGEGVRKEIADCFIITQTFMYIYDLEKAAHNVITMLKKGGVALITCSCLSQNSQRCMDNYGAYFNFNSAVFQKMFGKENATVIEAGSYGNVKTVMAHLIGMCAEDLSDKDFEYNDKYYPLIVYAVVRRDE